MKKYFILMGDIIDSRKIDSEQLWNDINEVINKARDKYSDKIISSLEIKVGDEFQTILEDMDSLLSMLLYLDILFRYKNINCRFAIGYGTVIGNINKKSAYNMLGSGLTNTNELLNNKKERYAFFIQDDIIKTILLNTIGILLKDVLSNLTKKQKEFLFYKVVGELTKEQIELKMEIKHRAFYDLMNRSKYNLLRNIFRQISDIFTFSEDYLSKKCYNEFSINILGD